MSKKATRKKVARLWPETIGVKSVATDSLKSNPHNPRLLFDREPLAVLMASIKKVGILVPLTVYRAKDRQKYTILDGERRWRCAHELALPTVPINQIAQPTVVQNIVTMFQIHQLREDWELMPTALKLEVLMEKLQERSDGKLAELTGLDRAVVARCKKLLSYPSKYQEMMLDPDPSKRVKADFFIELYAVRNDRTVNTMSWFRKDYFTRRMLEKYQNRESDLKAVTDFRIVKQYINNARKADKVASITEKLKEYTEDDIVSIEHLAIRPAQTAAGVRRLLNSVTKLEQEIRDLDVKEYYGEKKLWAALEKLVKLIRKRLMQADRRPPA